MEIFRVGKKASWEPRFKSCGTDGISVLAEGSWETHLKISGSGCDPKPDNDYDDDVGGVSEK